MNPIPRPRRRQRGVAAVELALVMPMLVVLLTFPIFFARFCWHYTVAQKAAQDAARYLSQVSAQEMRSQTLSRAAAAVATEIVRTEVGELAPGAPIGDPEVHCDQNICGFRGGSVPETVRVSVYVSFFDTFFGAVDTGRYGWPINAEITMRYVGN